MVWPLPEQYRDECRVGPESEMNEIKIRVQDEPRRSMASLVRGYGPVYVRLGRCRL